MNEQEAKAIIKSLSAREENEIRERLLDFREKGFTGEPKEAAENIKRLCPGVNPDVVRKLETEPGYLDEILRRNSSKVAGALGEIVDVLIERAKGGSVKHIAQLMELMGLANKRISVQNNTLVNNRLYVKKQADEEILAEYHELSGTD